MFHRLSWALTGALAIILVLTLARMISAGPLDPPGPVGSTMRTLDELVPAWDQQLASTGGCSSKRFTCVLPTAATPSGEGVLDHETGLVWEKVIDPAAAAGTWDIAQAACDLKSTGDRRGWRLPTFYEALTLLGPFTTTGVIHLPSGHPFVIGAPLTSSDIFGTSTARVSSGLGYSLDGSHVVLPRTGTGELWRTWCVRGEGGGTPP